MHIPIIKYLCNSNFNNEFVDEWMMNDDGNNEFLYFNFIY